MGRQQTHRSCGWSGMLQCHGGRASTIPTFRSAMRQPSQEGPCNGCYPIEILRQGQTATHWRRHPQGSWTFLLGPYKLVSETSAPTRPQCGTRHSQPVPHTPGATPVRLPPSAPVPSRTWPRRARGPGRGGGEGAHDVVEHGRGEGPAPICSTAFGPACDPEGRRPRRVGGRPSHACRSCPPGQGRGRKRGGGGGMALSQVRRCPQPRPTEGVA